MLQNSIIIRAAKSTGDPSVQIKRNFSTAISFQSFSWLIKNPFFAQMDAFVSKPLPPVWTVLHQHLSVIKWDVNEVPVMVPYGRGRGFHLSPVVTRIRFLIRPNLKRNISGGF